MLSPAGGAAHALPPDAAEPAGIDVGHLLRTLRQRLYIVVLMAVLGAALGVWVQSLITPRYTSYVSILLDPRRSDSFGAEAQFGSGYVDVAKIASVVSIIESSELLGRVVDELKLADEPEFGDPGPSPVRMLQQKLAVWLPNLVHVAPVRNDPATRRARALGVLEKSVHADRVNVTYALTVSATAAHPALAQTIAQAVADAYLDDQLGLKTAATDRDSTWLQSRLTDASHQLMQSEAAVEEIKRKYGLVETDRGGDSTTDRQTITELNAQLTQARTDVAARKAHYDAVARIRANGGSLEGLPEVAESKVISDLRKTQSDIASRLSDLTRIYQDNFPEVRRLKAQQATLQHQIDAEVGRIVESLRSEYETALAREQGLGDQLQTLTTDNAGTSEGRIRLRDAQRLVAANRGLYDSLLSRLRDVQQQQTRETPEARIISRADLPSQPSAPKPLIMPIGGAMAFMLLGLGLTLGPPLFERRFISVTDVERRLGLVVFGSIPLLKRRDLVSARRKSSVVDYTMRKPLSRFAESLRTLRAYLHISADGTPTVLQVTSAVPGEGKSTTAAALAMSAAAAGVRTVLVDADLRTCSLSTMFDQRHKPGLADILELGVPIRSVVRELDDTPLAVIGAGSAFLPRPDLVNSDRFGTFLAELARNYSLVIIDSPPVLPVSDALVISKYADATILVVQWRSTTKALAEQATKMLRMINAPLVGVMLNKVDLAKVQQYDYGYHYDYDRQPRGKGKPRRA